MIREVHGDMLTSTADVWVIPTNTYGVMGAGLAQQFKEQHPSVYNAYRARCLRHRPLPTEPFTLKQDNRLFVMFHTKEHWRRPSHLPWIDHNLRWLASVVSGTGTSVALPPVGCGLGGLDLDRDIRPLMDRYLNDLDEMFFLYVNDPL